MEQPSNIPEKDNNKKGIIISSLLHMLLLLLCLSPFLSFMSEERKEPLTGIMVAVGNPISETKQITNPAPSQSAEKVKKTSPKKSTTKPKKAATKKVSKSAKPVKKKIVSQTIEEESSVQATREKVLKKENKAKQEQQNREAKLAERKAREAAQEKAAEEARQAAQEAAEKAEREAAAQQASEKAKAKSKFNNLFAKGDQEAAASKGELNGKPDAKALEGISTGQGQTGSGFGDRQLLYAPTITDNSQKTGKVIIKICVDQSGKVSKAKYTQKGSTTTDAYLISLAEKNAKKYKFDTSSAAEQCGNVIIDFKLK